MSSTAIGTIIVCITGLIAIGILFFSKLQVSRTWQATVTPLASIIGSGFLVSVPLLSGEVGNYAIVAMVGLIVLSYLIGSAIRFNIRHTEPVLTASNPPEGIVSLEHLSHFVLAIAYFISVTYYLMLLSTFLLKGLQYPDAYLAKWITSIILAGIGLTGLWRGLGAIERIEKYTVGTNLAVIAALLAGLVWYNVDLAGQGSWQLADKNPEIGWHTAQLVLGMLIIVQGFETSRFMGAEYSAELRIRSMRNAQLISAAVYLIFFSLITVLFRLQAHDTGVAAIIDMVGHVALVLPFLLTMGAIASQFSASVADSIGAAGLLNAISGRKISTGHAYPLIAVIAIGLTWGTDIFGIINLASRAFALFYFFQCVIALLVAGNNAEIPHRTTRLALYAVLAVICLAVVLFAIPSGG